MPSTIFIYYDTSVYFLDATCGFLVWRMAGSFGSLDTDISSVSDCMWTIRETKTTEAIQVYIAKLYQETSDCASFNLEASIMIFRKN